MKDPERFKSNWISREQIASEAEFLRQKCPISCGQLPIRALDVAEFDLGLEIRLLPLGNLQGVALLLGDLKSVAVDEELFRSPAYDGRVNFSVAHEIGHLVLHREIYGQIQFCSVDEWIEFIERIPPFEYQKVEWQADQFAGEFLVPRQQLSVAFQESLRAAEEEGYLGLGKEAVTEFVCRNINQDFGVSPGVIKIRLRNDGLLDRIE